MCTMVNAADVIVQGIYGTVFNDVSPLVVDVCICIAMQAADVSNTANQLDKALFI